MAVFDLILGPILMGSFMSVLLLGVMIVQCYLYFQRYKSDKPWIRAIIWTLLLLDCLSASFSMAMSYNYLVTNFTNVAAIQVTNVGIDPYPFLTGVTALIVQCFFAWRILVLTKNWIIVAIIVLLSVVQMLGSLGTMIGGLIVKEFVKLESIKQISLVWLLGSVVTDALITISLVRFLQQSRGSLRFSSTDDITSRIIRSTVQTGLLTTTFALGVVVAYLASSSTVHLAFGLPLSKLYTNSLLSSLNARQAWTSSEHGSDTLALSKTAASGFTGIQVAVTSVSAVHPSDTARTQTSTYNDEHEMQVYGRRSPSENKDGALV